MSKLVMRMKDNNLMEVRGGGAVSSIILSYLSTAIKAVYGVGQGFGGAIRRIANKSICPL